MTLSKTFILSFFLLQIAFSFPVVYNPTSYNPFVIIADTVAKSDSSYRNDVSRSRSIDIFSAYPSYDSKDIIQSDAIYLGNLLTGVPTFFLSELGEPGLPPRFSLGGVDSRGTGLFLDGTQLIDPYSGLTNLYDVPLDFFSGVKILSAANSFIYGKNSVAGGIHLFSHQYANSLPKTKIRFVQGPFGHILTDGLFSQNIFKKLNLMIGFQRHVGDGRFTNAKYDSWQLRSRLSYYYSTRLNFSITYLLNDSRAGLNYGIHIDSTRSIYEEASASVINPKIHHRLSYNDLNFATNVSFFADTTSVTKFNFRLTNSDRELNDRGVSDPNLMGPFDWKTYSAQLEQHIYTDGIQGLLRLQYEKSRYHINHESAYKENRYFSVSAKADFTLIGGIIPSLSAKHESDDNAPGNSIGMEVTAEPFSWLSLYSGYSESVRFPTFLESNWPASQIQLGLSGKRFEDHKTLEFNSLLRITKNISLSLLYSSRQIQNAIVIRTKPSADMLYPLAIMDISPTLKFDHFAFEGKGELGNIHFSGMISFGNIREGSESDAIIPRYSGFAELIYKDALFSNVLHSRIGIRARFSDQHRAAHFFPTSLLYGIDSQKKIPPYSTLDLFGTFSIGDVFLHLTLGNVLDKDYYTIPTYPNLGRHLRLGVVWFFSD